MEDPILSSGSQVSICHIRDSDTRRQIQEALSEEYPRGIYDF